MAADHRPHDDLLPVERAVLLRPDVYAVLAWLSIVRILAADEALLWVKPCRPQVLLDERRPACHHAVGPAERAGRVGQREPVCGRLSVTVAPLGALDQPVTPAGRIGQALCLGFTAQRCADADHGVAVRVKGRIALTGRVLLHEAVAGSVDRRVEPDPKVVLVQRGLHQLRDHAAVTRALARLDPRRREDSGELDLQLDPAVLVQRPVEPVVVVGDRLEVGDDQLP